MFLYSDNHRTWDDTVENGSIFWDPKIPAKNIEGQKLRIIHFSSNNPKYFENRTRYYLCAKNVDKTFLEPVASKFLGTDANGCGEGNWLVPSTRNELIEFFNDNDFSDFQQPIRTGYLSSNCAPKSYQFIKD